MKKYLKTLSIIMLICCSLLIFTGCGPKDDDKDPESNEVAITYDEFITYVTNSSVTTNFKNNFKFTQKVENSSENLTASGVANSTTSNAYITIKGTADNITYNIEAYLNQGVLYVASTTANNVNKYYINFDSSIIDLSDELELIFKYLHNNTQNGEISEMPEETYSNMMFSKEADGETNKYSILYRVRTTNNMLTSETNITNELYFNKHTLTKSTYVSKYIFDGVETSVDSTTTEATTETIKTPVVSEYTAFESLA